MTDSDPMVTRMRQYAEREVLMLLRGGHRIQGVLQLEDDDDFGNVMACLVSRPRDGSEPWLIRPADVVGLRPVQEGTYAPGFIAFGNLGGR